MSPHSEDSCRVTIVGASSLRGKELREVLEARNFPAADFVLLDDSVTPGTLTEAGGEPTFIRSLARDSFEGSRFVFFAGRAEEATRNWAAARTAGSTVIDLSSGLANQAGAFPWIPALSKLLPPPEPNGTNGTPSGALYSSPAAGAVIACTLAAGLKDLAPVRMVILFFPPVSQRDQAGVDELESQTTDLLSFRPISQPVFDAQVAFNLLSGYGEASRPPLAEARAGVVNQVSRYLAGRVAMPAIQLIQAPVFFGYAFAAYVELSASMDPVAIEKALAAAGIQVAALENPPSNVSVAGESEIHLARVIRDSSVPAGYWLWGATDNLRLAATNAVQIAEELIVTPV
jgi:aspartate-semialdehyde dehydrogenase